MHPHCESHVLKMEDEMDIVPTTSVLAKQDRAGSPDVQGVGNWIIL
jgi:hypothetical protein